MTLMKARWNCSLLITYRSYTNRLIIPLESPSLVCPQPLLLLGFPSYLYAVPRSRIIQTSSELEWSRHYVLQGTDQHCGSLKKILRLGRWPRTTRTRMKSYWPYLMICEKGKTACVKESVTVHHTCKECGAESFSYPEKSEKLCYFKPSEAGSSFNTKESVPHLTQNKVSIKRSIA